MCRRSRILEQSISPIAIDESIAEAGSSHKIPLQEKSDDQQPGPSGISSRLKQPRYRVLEQESPGSWQVKMFLNIHNVYSFILMTFCLLQ